MTTHDDPRGTDADPRLEALARFLLARLDEDEAAARAVVLSGDLLPYESILQTADHGARHGPLRVLREVAATKAAVSRILEAGPPGSDPAHALVAALACVFAEHPDFDPEWLAVVDEGTETPDNVVQLPLLG